MLTETTIWGHAAKGTAIWGHAAKGTAILGQAAKWTAIWQTDEQNQIEAFDPKFMNDNFFRLQKHILIWVLRILIFFLKIFILIKFNFLL